MKSKAKKRFAFWRYDQFPYCLGAEIDKVEKNNIVEPPNYGGYRFKAFKIMDYEKGKELKEKLEALKEERQSVIDTLEKGYESRLKELIRIPSWSEVNDS